MKMKKITLGCSIIVAAILFVTGCNKKTNTPPEQDKEFQSSQDVAFANSVVADIETICSFMGENLLLTNFFLSAPGSMGTIVTSRDTALRILKVIYTGSVTCMDGKRRNGEIRMAYTSVPIENNAKFYRQPYYVASVTLHNYWVDGWSVDDVVPFTIKNNLINNYNPTTTPLNWTIEGEFTINNDADGSKNMTWKGKYNKTLVNSTVATVFNPNKLFPIAWITTSVTPGANIEYTGRATGVTSGSKPYIFKIDSLNPLKRLFSCTPDKVLGVISSTTMPITITPVFSEWHPFIGGVANFTTNNLPEARRIDFSDNGNLSCDNAGKVTIKGIDYPIDFPK
jgi:hypothetical protein